MTPRPGNHRRMARTLWRLLNGGVAVCLALTACAQATPTPSLPAPTAEARLVPPEVGEGVVPAFEAHLARVRAVADFAIPILLLDELDPEPAAAQALAIRDPRLQRYLRDPNTGLALRNEIFNVHPVRASDLTPATEACRTAACFRVELYNYAYNLTTIAVVNITQPAVLAVNDYPEMQPDLNPALTELALAVVREAFGRPGAAEAIGISPDQATVLMASTKTALNDSLCERSRHLCVAPTFVLGDRALWTIVDLTAGTLVGVRWTDLGAATGRLTQQALQNEAVMNAYCDQTLALDRDGWAFTYMLTSSDGLRLADVRYQGRPVLESAKLVDWHVNYSQTDGFGYSDAVGCPMFSAAAVVAFQGPVVVDLPGGFAVVQEFRSEIWPQPCNYSYQQRYEFYTDGRFRMVVGSLGRGCGVDGTYRPVLRLDPPGEALTFAEWAATGWTPWAEERWALETPATPLTAEGYQYQWTDGDGRGFFLAPNRGQFGDGSRGDNAYVYVTRDHGAARDEGEADLITIGPCCNTDYRQGPEKFIEPAPEPLLGQDLVVWVVPQLKNDGEPGREYCWADLVLENGVYVPRVWPCYAGPMFVPVAP